MTRWSCHQNCRSFSVVTEENTTANNKCKSNCFWLALDCQSHIFIAHIKIPKLAKLEHLHSPPIPNEISIFRAEMQLIFLSC